MRWAERAADRSPIVQRSRDRSIEQAQQIVAAARRLVEADPEGFTTHQLAKEAGIAIQTFYRYFPGKDELLLAVLEEWIAEGCAAMQERAAALSDPLDRLRLYVTATIEALAMGNGGISRFITSEHHRLHQIFPDELAVATRLFTEMLIPEIEAAAEAGLLAPADIGHDAWMVTQLSMTAFHHYAFATTDEPMEVVADRLWTFCLGALGGRSS